MLRYGHGINDKLLSISSDELTSTLGGEGLVFDILARGLYVYDDRAWLQSLADDGVFEDIPFAGSQPDVVSGMAELRSWSEKNRGGMSDAAYDDIKADYTRLFVVPGESFTPPWESVYFNVDQMVFQEQTMQVRACYRRFGLEAENLNKEPDDHIAMELSFIGYQALRALDALNAQDYQVFQEAIGAQKGFLCDHLLQWGPQWCRRMSSVARTEFYRGMALLTSGTLHEITRVLGLEVE
jgi:TorA maturation chaperone TorD